jgi:hypothetical protein
MVADGARREMAGERDGRTRIVDAYNRHIISSRDLIYNNSNKA